MDLSYKKLEDNGILLPVSDYQIKYILPALYDEELNIKCMIKKSQISKSNLITKLITKMINYLILLAQL